jgi:hypothetical protein
LWIAEYFQGFEMKNTPYDYKHRLDVRPVSWEDFHGICKGLVVAVASYNPDFIVAIGRGGFYPGTLLAHILRVELQPVHLSRREEDVVTHDRPRWITRPSDVVKGARVLIVDEICDSGETLTIVRETIKEMGARMVRTAVLYAHTWGAAVPDYVGLVTDALILNPWDREIWAEGGFQFHPEYIEALSEQDLEPTESLRINAPVIQPAKVHTGQQPAKPGNSS